MKASTKRIVGVVLVGIPLALLGAWTAVGCASTRGVETPAYSVVSKNTGYEVREYPASIHAEVTLRGEYRETLYGGFRKVADYIFGNNSTRQSVAMTAPVLHEESQKIAMTAPVIHEKSKDDKSYTVAFIMPKQYTLETLPRPNNSDVTLREVPPKRYATLSFSGYATERRAEKKTTHLLAALQRDGITPTAQPVVAQYDPPWTPPFMRRNEIQVELP